MVPKSKSLNYPLSSAVRKHPRKRWLYQKLLVLLFTTVVLILVYSRREQDGSSLRFGASTQKLCPTVWSHRGHLDASVKDQGTCMHVLSELHKHGIFHLDIDVMWYDNELVVAHPTEILNNDPNFSASPCSKISLESFQALLISEYNDQYYITIEPKASWKEDQKGGILAEPRQVLEQLASYFEGKHSTFGSRVGIILEPWQRQSIFEPSAQRLSKICDVVLPLRRDVMPLDEQDLPPDDYKYVMPTIELFEGKAGRWYMDRTKEKEIDNVAWVIDNEEKVDRAIEFGIQHVVSNNPVRLRSMMEENGKCMTNI